MFPSSWTCFRISWKIEDAEINSAWQNKIESSGVAILREQLYNQVTAFGGTSLLKKSQKHTFILFRGLFFMNTRRHQTRENPLTLWDIHKRIIDYRMNFWQDLVSSGETILFDELVYSLTHMQGWWLRKPTTATQVTPENTKIVIAGVNSFLESIVWVQRHDLDHVMKIVMPPEHPYM